MRNLEESGAKKGNEQAATSPASRQECIANEQWQNNAELNKRRPDYTAANRALSQLFGCPTIVGKDGNVYLTGHISNVPEVSKPVQSIEDLQALGTGIGSGLRQGVRDTLNWLTRKDAVNDELMRAKAFIEQEIDYCKHASPNEMGRDTQHLLQSAGQALEDKLGYPMTVERRGKYAGRAMSIFVFTGRNKPLGEYELKNLGGVKKLEQMTNTQLEAIGIKHVADYGLTRLSKEELGLAEQFHPFEATKKMKDGVQTVSIDFIQSKENGGSDLVALMNSLRAQAQKEGAGSLKIETQFKNPRLEDIWAKRYNMTPDKHGRYSMIIDLKEEH